MAHISRLPLRAALFTAGVFVAAACGDSINLEAPAAAPNGRGDVAERSLVAKDVAVTSSMSFAPRQGSSNASAPMVIRTGYAHLTVDSLEPAISAVHSIAARHGGTVGNTMLSSGDYERRSASIELRIPAARFDEALAGLRPLGRLESVSTTAQDVSEEFVDVSARMANAKRLEERLVSLLTSRTGKLEEVLAVERELARVREEIERHEGRIRFLQTRVAMSTLTVSVQEPVPLITQHPGRNVIAESFKDAWRNFVAFVAGFIAMLGVLVPVVVLAAPVLYYARKFWLERRAASSTP